MSRALWKLYPNIFTILVGRPGIGKGAAMNPALALLKEANTANVLSDRLTIEFVLEKLSKGFTHAQPSTSGVTSSFQVGTDSSAIIFSPELSIFITASMATLPIMADLWDSREGAFDYGTRHKGLYRIKSPCVSMLAGSTQEWLIDSIPNNAVGGGFTRRVNFVYASKRAKFIPFPATPNSSKSRDALVNDLRHISSSVRGEFTMAQDLRTPFEAYYRSCEPGTYDDEAVTAYKTSKWAHALKLATVFSACRDDSKEIGKDDFERATDMVDAVAKDLPMVFRAVGESDLVAGANRVMTFLENKGYASREEILRANWRHISSDDLDRIIVTLTEGGILGETHSGRKIKYSVIRGKQP